MRGRRPDRQRRRSEAAVRSSAAANAVGAAWIGRCGAVDAAELLGARMDMHERLAAAAECRTACSPATAISPSRPPTSDHEVGGLDPLEELRIGADAEIAGVAGMSGCRRGAGGGTWCTTGSAKLLGKARDGVAGRLRPAAAAEDHDRAARPRRAARRAAPSRRGRARSRSARRPAHRSRRCARSACPRAARRRPDRAGRSSRCGRRARRSPGCAPDRRSRSPISPSSRTRRDNRAPETPRARAFRARPGRRT